MVGGQLIAIFQKGRESQVDVRSLVAAHAMIWNVLKTPLEAVLTREVGLQRLSSLNYDSLSLKCLRNDGMNYHKILTDLMVPEKKGNRHFDY